MIKMLKELYLKNKEIIHYIIVGGLTTLVSWGTYYVCVNWIFDTNRPIQLQIAVILRWLSGVIFAYFTNRAFVFESKNKNMLLEGFTFASSRIVTLIMDMVVMWLMVSLLLINEWVSTLVSSVLVVFTNYFLSKFIVFKKKKD